MIIQTNPLITARNFNLQEKKKELAIWWILSFRWITVKIEESEKKDNYLDLAREVKMLWNMKVTAIVIVAFGTIPKSLEKKTGEFWNPDKNRYLPVQSTVKIG